MLRSATGMGWSERLSYRVGPTVPGHGPKVGPAPCGGFFIFSIFFYNSRNLYKLLKYVEITIMLKKIQNKFPQNNLE
jgi:hypothetical protein